MGTIMRNGREYGGGSGTSDYDMLSNQPKINNVTLVGNLTWQDLGLPDFETGLPNGYEFAMPEDINELFRVDSD